MFSLRLAVPLRVSKSIVGILTTLIDYAAVTLHMLCVVHRTDVALRFCDETNVWLNVFFHCVLLSRP
jgi:hypothetical protein